MNIYSTGTIDIAIPVCTGTGMIRLCTMQTNYTVWKISCSVLQDLGIFVCPS